MNLQKAIKGVFANEKVILFLFIFLYLSLELINIRLPGLYADEAFSACGSLQIIKRINPLLLSRKVFNIHIPFMRGPYATALESYILLPFFCLFGVNVVALRLAPILIGAGALLFMYFFLRDFFSRSVALLCLFLTVINSTFLVETKLGLNTASMLHFTAMAALWSLFKWYRNKEVPYLYLGVFFLSVGISVRVWFLWFFNGMVILAVIFNHEVRERIKGNICKHVAIIIAVFLISNILFVYYNLVSNFETIKYIVRHFAETHSAVNNFVYFNNLQQRFFVFIEYLKGSWTLNQQGVSSQAVNILGPFIFLLIFIYLAFAALFNKTKAGRKKVSFILILFSLIFLQSPFTLSNLGGPHLFILYPLVQIILGLGIIDSIRSLKKNIIIPAFIIFITFIFVGLECNNNIKNNYLYYNKTGGAGRYSDSIYGVTQYLLDNKIYKPVVMSWGITHSLVFLSEGKLTPRSLNYVESQGGSEYKSEFVRDLRLILKDNNRYIFRSPQFTNWHEATLIFNSVVSGMGKRPIAEKIFFQRDGVPVYIIYSLRE